MRYERDWNMKPAFASTLRSGQELSPGNSFCQTGRTARTFRADIDESAPNIAGWERAGADQPAACVQKIMRGGK